MYGQLWITPRTVIRPDKIYSEATLLDVLDMEPDDIKSLAEWRDLGVGPSFMKLPNGEVRYYGEAVLSFVQQPHLEISPDEVQ